MTRQEIEKYLQLLGQELDKKQLTGEIIIAGGAFMLLAIQNRETTKDIDASLMTKTITGERTYTYERHHHP